MHTHSDIQVLVPRCTMKVRQGVTCDVMARTASRTHRSPTRCSLRCDSARGLERGSAGFRLGLAKHLRVPRPLRRRRRHQRGDARSPRHGSHDCTGGDDRAPTDAELAEMKRIVGQGIEDGAVGLSSGLTYAPGMFATDDELSSSWRCFVRRAATTRRTTATTVTAIAAYRLHRHRPAGGRSSPLCPCTSRVRREQGVGTGAARTRRRGPGAGDLT